MTVPTNASAPVGDAVRDTRSQSSRLSRPLHCASVMPIHWGTSNLAPHPWAEPGEWMKDVAGGGAAGRLGRSRPRGRAVTGGRGDLQ
nr:hypothetical protein C5F59_03720 [Streptomyces sp. QL37]